MSRARSEEETISLLRGTLAGRAAVVTRAAEIPDVADIGVARRRVPRWVPPLAAAAAAAAVAGTVVAIQHSTGHPTPPANSTGVTSPAPTHTLSPPNPNGGRFCTTKLPTAWRQALTTPLDLRSSKDVQGAGVLADGSLLVKLGQGRTTEVALVAPDGSVTDLLSVPAQSGETVADDIDGDQAVLMVIGRRTVTRLYLYDDRTRQQTPISLPSSVDGAGAGVMDGTVYWAERASSTSNTGRVIAEDPATGSTRVVWRGTFPRFPWLQTTAGGVYIGTAGNLPNLLIAPRNLPGVVAAHITPEIRQSLLVSDGTSYAWLTSPVARVLYLWAPGMPAPERLRLGEGSPKLAGGGSANFAIDGRWLFALQGNVLLDLDTGAMAKLPENSPLDIVGLAGGYLVGIEAPAPRRITDPFRSYITRLPLAGLPDLHC